MEIYVHIPFCKHKCDYCDFYSLANCDETAFSRYAKALEKEIRLAAPRFADRRINTLFVGGGTPSLLGGERIASIVNLVKASFDCRLEEVSVECNPESATDDFFDKIVKAGCNRISIGVQSLCDKNLQAVGRIHNASTALDAIKRAKSYFEHVSCDFIVGLPFDTANGVVEQIEKVVNLGVDHISCYELILDEGTPLFHNVESGQIRLQTDDEVQDMFDVAVDCLKANGFDRYEISNFAKHGCESKHNLGYWTREEYLGFGPAAHSYVKDNTGEKRFANIGDLNDYIKAVEGTELPFASVVSSETLTQQDVVEETLYLGLRTSQGVDKSLVPQDRIEKYAAYFVTNGDKIALNDKGMAVQDAIVEDLI